MERQIFPIALRTQCNECGATMGLFVRDYQLGTRVMMVCGNCGAEYQTALALSPIKEPKAPIATAFLRAWDNDKSKNDNQTGL